jgi:transcription elongation GreA/GreB family factor
MSVNRSPITAKGKVFLEQKLKNMINRKPDLLNELVEAQKKGDFSENFEYYAAKKELRELEFEIKELEAYISSAMIIQLPKNPTTACFGSKVTLQKDSEVVSYIILGEKEAEPLCGSLSNNSPLFQLFGGQKVGYTTSLKGYKYTIKGISPVTEDEVEAVLKATDSKDKI